VSLKSDSKSFLRSRGIALFCDSEMVYDLEKKLGRTRKDIFKSEGERRIAYFLDNYGIRYVYEQGLLVKDRDKPKIWHPDFFLPEFALYIEYYGMAGNQDYDRGIEHKKSVYDEMGLDVLSVYPWTFCDDWQGYLMDNLYQVSNRRLGDLDRKGYRRGGPKISYGRRYS